MDVVEEHTFLEGALEELSPLGVVGGLKIEIDGDEQDAREGYGFGPNSELCVEVSLGEGSGLLGGGLRGSSLFGVNVLNGGLHGVSIRRRQLRGGG